MLENIYDAKEIHGLRAGNVIDEKSDTIDNPALRRVGDAFGMFDASDSQSYVFFCDGGYVFTHPCDSRGVLSLPSLLALSDRETKIEEAVFTTGFIVALNQTKSRMMEAALTESR